MSNRNGSSDALFIANRRYTTVRSLGEGAQGVVYLVEDRYLGNALIALKLLRPQATREWRSAFKNEFETLAGLVHPRLARVHDFGKTRDGRVFFTRDFIDGVDLRTAASRKKMHEIIGLFVEVCRALKPLHGRGLLHGDLKPGNVICSTSEVAHLIDFSFVRPSGLDARRQGTVQFMAPEVIEGKAVDVRADLYALGATIFDVIAGGPPFDGRISEIVSGHLGTARPCLEPVRVADKSKECLSIFEGLKSIVARLLARNPADRFPDIIEVEAALLALCPGNVFPDPLPDHPVLHESVARHREMSRIRGVVEARLSRSNEERNSDETPLKIVVGELGTGKSSVLRGIKWWAELGDVVVIEARCTGAGGLLGPIAEIVDQAVGYLAGSEAGQMALGDHLVGRLGDPKSAGTDINGLAREASDLLREISCRKKLIVAIDDVEQSSPEALQIIRGIVAGFTPRDQAVVLASAEPSFPWQEAIGGGESVTLPGLTGEQIEPLVRAFLGRAEPGVVERVRSHTGGNPLFVVTLLRDLVASGEGAERLERLGAPRQLEVYWRDRLILLDPVEKKVLNASAVLGRPAKTEDIATVAGHKTGETEAILSALESDGWMRLGPLGWHVSTHPLRDQILSRCKASPLLEFHRRAVHVEPDEAKKLLHMARSGDTESAIKKGRQVAASLEYVGALHACRDLLTELLPVVDDDDFRMALQLDLGRVCLSQGDYAVAEGYLSALRDSRKPEVRRQALLLLGRLQSVLGKLSEATRCLDEVLAIGGNPTDESRALLERANIEFKKGELKKSCATGESGLGRAPPGDPVRADLKGILAKAATRDGRIEEALECAREAVEEARTTGNRRSLALALEILAWVRQHSGDLAGAIQELEKAVKLNREFGDYPRLMRDQQVLGDLKYWREEWREALEHYEESMRLAGAVANPIQHLRAKIVFGMQLAKLGRFAKAQLILRRAEEESRVLGHEELRLEARFYQADLLAASGQINEAMECYYKPARRELEETGHVAYLADLELEMAGWCLWRAAAGDLELGRELIGSAADRKREYEGRNFTERLLLQRGSMLIADGDFEKGRSLLSELVERMNDSGLRDIAWQAHLVIARGYANRGSAFLARGRLRQAEAALERLSKGFSEEHHRAFWQDIRRTEVRRLLAETKSSTSLESSRLGEQVAKPLDPEADALYRVLEFNKRISAEHDINRLLDAILDAAVELTGAERGLILMARGGSLEVEATRAMDAGQGDGPHGRFSRSIAESVHLDGEPVITVDAMGDDRFSDFLSIHELKLRSVACLPVRYRGQGIGVLYLENRFQRGRFGGRDLRVLSAFADQVAIAIAQARLLEDFHQKEVELREARRAIEAAFNRQSLDLDAKDANLRLTRERLDRARRQLEGAGDYHGVIGTASSMRNVFSLVERVKDLDVPVVFVGESGTGKDLLARVLHDKSHRQNGPFVVMNCGGVPETLVEATLFGHVKGAFSGAGKDRSGILQAAHQGTLYLDEVGDMSPRMQVDFLRVLQEENYVPLGSSQTIAVDIRLVVSSKSPLEELAEQGRLRKDLLYRLQVVEIVLPPLRDRKEDILPLAEQFLERSTAQMRVARRLFSKAAVDGLMAHDWPGNVRELEQAIRRAVVVGEGIGAIGIEELFGRGKEPAIEDVVSDALPTRGTPGTKEGKRILEALERCHWNRTKAAKELGIPRRTFYRKLDKLGLLKKGGLERG